ncbi:MAG TPA: IS110 family transposase [Acidimicrobiia bacterium]|nr:IS110 family transposase [Acidimicrobiia bacterium]
MHVGMDLGRNSMVVALLTDGGELVAESSVRPDAAGLGRLVDLTAQYCTSGEVVDGVVESMTGARFVYDFLTGFGWRVAIADALAVKGIGRVAAKTDKIDARVLADLSRRDLVPAIWIPDQEVRSNRERARFRIFLVHQRTGLKNRIHSGLIEFGRPCPVSDLFGKTGRQLLNQLDLNQPWAEHIGVCLQLIDHYDRLIAEIERDLRQQVLEHPYLELLVTVPGIGHILAYTIASEIGDINRFPTPKKLVGYTGLAPRVHQSGGRDLRGPLTRNGPKHLRWALIEAAVHAAHHPVYAHHYQRTKQRLGRQQGPKVARVEVARRITTAIWWMLTKQQPFAPQGPTRTLAA